MKYSIRAWVPLAAFLIFASPAVAKTITLTDEDSDRMAAIAEVAPNSSWAGSVIVGGVIYDGTIDITPVHSFLIRFPLDQIPKDQRITKAELTFPVSIAPAEQKVLVRRIVGSWGAGVSWNHRQVNGKKLAWTTPGAKAGGKDRVTKPTATIKLNGAGEATANLTEDVELWYSGAAANEGWIFTNDAPEGFVRIPSPTWVNTGAWKLRVTYEPK